MGILSLPPPNNICTGSVQEKAVTSRAFSKRQWPKGTLLLCSLLTGQVWQLRLMGFSQFTCLSNQDSPPTYFWPLCKRPDNTFITPTARVTISLPLSVQDGVRSPAPPSWLTLLRTSPGSRRAQLWCRPKMAPTAPPWGDGEQRPAPCATPRATPAAALGNSFHKRFPKARPETLRYRMNYFISPPPPFPALTPEQFALGGLGLLSLCPELLSYKSMYLLHWILKPKGGPAWWYKASLTFMLGAGY